jgi:hypothetical protein
MRCGHSQYADVFNKNGVGVLTSNITTKTIDWVRYVIPYVRHLLESVYTTFKPTIRGVFYRAGSEEIIPLTQPIYKGLVKALSTARKNKVIAMDAFTDNSRRVIDIDEQYWEPIQFVNDLTGKLRDLHKYTIILFRDGIISHTILKYLLKKMPLSEHSRNS